MRKCLFILIAVLAVTGCATTSSTGTGSSISAKGFASLHKAVIKGDNEKVIALLDNGSDINEKSQYRTPVQVAVESNNLEACSLLIERGAKIDVVWSLDKALGNGYLEIADLIYSTIDMGSENYAESPILHQAADSFEPGVIKYMLDKGYNVNTLDKVGDSALVYAAMAYGPKLNHVDPILENADQVKNNFVGDMPNYGSNASSVQKRNVQSVMILLDNGIDINSQNNYGWSVLHYASFGKPTGLVEILLANDADKSLLTNFERSAFDLAKAGDKQESMIILE